MPMPKPIKQRLSDGRAIRAEATAEDEGGRWRWRIRRCEAPREAITEAVLGRSPTGTRADVERALVRYATDQRAAPEGQDARLRSVADLMSWHAKASEKWAAQGDLSTATALMRRRTATVLQECRGGELSVHGLRVGDVEVLRDALRRRYRSSTTRTHLEHVAGAWSWARGHGLVPDRDFPAVHVADAQDARPRRTPTLGELAAVAAAAGQPWHRHAILLLCATGCREGEIAQTPHLGLQGLLAERIDWTGQRIEVSGKTGRRWVPLSHDPEAWAALIAHLGDRREGPVFAESQTSHALAMAVYAACDTTGVARFSPNGIRRRVSFQLLGSGIHPAAYESWMGHSYQMALKVYQTEEAVAPEVEAAAAKVNLKRPAGVVVALPKRRSG